MGAADLLGRIEIFLVAVPGVAWFAVLLELARSGEQWRGRAAEVAAVVVVAVLALVGAGLAAGSKARCASGTG